MKREKCDYCAQSGIDSKATHEIGIDHSSMAYGTGADDDTAYLCDECFSQIGDEPERRGDLTHVAVSGAHITPETWGDTHIITDDAAASESMLMCGFTRDDGAPVSAGEFEAEIGDETYTVYEYRGKFYAMEDDGVCGSDPMYAECQNPHEWRQGLSRVYGSWKRFSE